MRRTMRQPFSAANCRSSASLISRKIRSSAGWVMKISGLTESVALIFAASAGKLSIGFTSAWLSTAFCAVSASVPIMAEAISHCGSAFAGPPDALSDSATDRGHSVSPFPLFLFRFLYLTPTPAQESKVFRLGLRGRRRGRVRRECRRALAKSI